jgi:hypothetical protein
MKCPKESNRKTTNPLLLYISVTLLPPSRQSVSRGPISKVSSQQATHVWAKERERERERGRVRERIEVSSKRERERNIAGGERKIIGKMKEREI